MVASLAHAFLPDPSDPPRSSRPPEAPGHVTDVTHPIWQSQARAAIEPVRDRRDPEELHPWLEEYEKVSRRPRFLWSWVLRGLEITALSSVAEKFRHEAQMIKVLGVMLDCLLDDIADVRQDPVMLEIALKIPVENDE